MNTKLNNKKSRKLLQSNGISINSKNLHGLKNVLLNATKSTKYIVTLKRRNKSNSSGVNLITETRKVITTAEDVLMGKSMFNTKYMPRISILETIDELSENSNTSFNETKQNLKNKPTKIAINRLRGGWGVGKIKKRKSQSRNQDGSNDTSENGAGNIVSNTISVKENEQDEESELANKASNKDLDNETQIKEKPNQEYKIDVVLNENINKVLLHKEENNKQTEANKISLETDASSTTKANGKSLITSSFIDKVLDEILPQPLTKCELKDLIPSCGKMLSIETQCNLLDIDETEAKLAAELFCRLSCDEKTSKRIECLERDVEKFSCELIDLQKELLPAEDLAKFNVISKCFNEINDLLVELKLNCLKLQNIENLKGETEVENPNCCEFCHCEIFGRFPCERKDVCNFSQCTTSLQGSSMFDVQDIHDLRNPLCPNDLCYSQHYSLYRSGNSHNEEAVRAFRTSGKSYEIADENNDDKSIFTDNMPNISQSNAYNRNSITISNKQINDIQNQFYKENSNTSMNHQHISRHEAGRDSTISSGNKILKGSSFKDSISSTYPIVPATTNNLSNRIWQIIGNTFELTSTNYLKTEENSTNKTQNMPDPNETYTRIQSVRVRNLEQQVHLMYGELQRIREGMLTRKDLIRLGNLLERLKELNTILVELRNHYMQQTNYEGKDERFNIKSEKQCNENCVKSLELGILNNNELSSNKHDQKELREKVKNYHRREDAGYDQENSLKSREVEENAKELQIKNEQTDELNSSLKTCKELMEERKPPGSILGNYLFRLQDFRTDPELRLQRWQRKQQKKLKQLPQNNDYIKESSTTNETIPQIKNTIIDKRTQVINSETDSGLVLDLPLVKHNLVEFVNEIINDIDRDLIALTVVLENDHIYHINISLISSGDSLSCFLATEEAIQEARSQHLFRDIITFFVVNTEYSEAQKDQFLGYTFEFMNMNDQ